MNKNFIIGGIILFIVATAVFSVAGYLYYLPENTRVMEEIEEEQDKSTNLGVEESTQEDNIDNKKSEGVGDLLGNELFPVLPAPEIKPAPIPQTTSDDPVCYAIANDEALRSLSDALLYMFGSSLENETRSVIREAIMSLNRISQDADDKLSYELKNTADMLDILVSAQAPTEEIVNNAVDALASLGEEAQDLCEFF